MEFSKRAKGDDVDHLLLIESVIVSPLALHIAVRSVAGWRIIVEGIQGRSHGEDG